MGIYREFLSLLQQRLGRTKLPPEIFQLPTLQPESSILPLDAADITLAAGVDQVPYPPHTVEDKGLIYHVGIRQAVYIGTHFLNQLYTNPPGGSSHLPAIMIYRHMLDLGDSIGTLLRFHSGQTGFILLRSIFESSLALELLLEGNKFHEDRGNAYWASFRIQQWENCVKYDPGTIKGERLHGVIDKTPWLRDAEFPRKNLSEERAKLETVLESDSYKPYWEKYQAAKKERRSTEWYSLCTKAQNRRELAALLNREAEYDIHYSYLSGVAHTSDVFSGVLERLPGNVEIHQLRGPEQKMEEVTTICAGYLLDAHLLIHQTHLKSNEGATQMFKDWYSNYRPFFLWKTNRKDPLPK